MASIKQRPLWGCLCKLYFILMIYTTVNVLLNKVVRSAHQHWLIFGAQATSFTPICLSIISCRWVHTLFGRYLWWTSILSWRVHVQLACAMKTRFKYWPLSTFTPTYDFTFLPYQTQGPGKVKNKKSELTMEADGWVRISEKKLLENHPKIALY